LPTNRPHPLAGRLKLLSDRLIFVTAGRYRATSTHMDYYDGVVKSEANSVAGLAALVRPG
jgi:hypothetical protein